MNESMWEERAYVDEFNMPTDDYYISNSEAIIGTFSNSATTNSMLGVWIYVDDNTVLIKLIEYGSNVVKNSSSQNKTYSAVMMDSNEKKYYLNGVIPTGYDTIVFDSESSAEIIQALSGNGTVYFAIMEDERPTTKYTFSIEDTNGLETCAPITSISYQGAGLFRIYKHQSGKYGLVDTKGNIVVRNIYYYIGDVSEKGLMWVATEREIDGIFSYVSGSTTYTPTHWGLIDTTGNLIIPCEYEHARDFSEGLACVKKNDKWGFIDTMGNLMIPCEYDFAGDFNEGLAYVEKNDKRGYVDTTGNLVIPCEYEDARDFSEGLACIKKDDKWGYVDTTGNLVIPCEYDKAGSFCEGLAYVKKNDKRGYVDTTGNLVIPCEYEDARDFSEGLACVKKNDKWGYVDTTGNSVIPYEYDWAGLFDGGLACVEKDDKWGFIDTTGNLVIPCGYDDAEYFCEGLACVEKDDKWGFINTKGKLIIPCEYEYVEDFNGGFAKIEKDDKDGLIDAKGNLIIPCEYNNIAYGDGYFALLKDGEITIMSNGKS